MREVILFAGTTEGREIAQALDAAAVPAIVCVATAYGKMVLTGTSHLDIREGRVDEGGMEALLGEHPGAVVVDATHPFAEIVSANLREACRNCDHTYLRVKRDMGTGDTDGVVPVYSASEAAHFLNTVEGNILLTTGSKDLKTYMDIIADPPRVYARVIPAQESLRLCYEAGLTGRQIIAVQGPFGESFHEAMLRNYEIAWQVTKQSGRAGGVEEKISAAKHLGCGTVMIEREVSEAGISTGEALHRLSDLLGITLDYQKNRERTLHLIGIGPGSLSDLTEGSREAIRESQVVFGAKSILSRATEILDPARQRLVPEYRAAVIGESLQSAELSGVSKACALYSGDPGFYSGARNLTDVCGWKIVRHPGISSMQYLAAKAGIPWDDASVISCHGRSTDVPDRVRRSAKTFAIVSQGGDIRGICGKFSGDEAEKIKVIAGRDLGSGHEQILVISAQEAAGYDYLPGLWCAFFLNPEADQMNLIPVIADSDMLRAHVPMTKEEIRHLSVLSLHLKREDVLYDIGAGTGSISVEAAGICESIQVYAIEKNEEACELILRNREHFHRENLEVIHGNAPQALEGLHPPDCVFIGGSGGSLDEIFGFLHAMRRNIRFVLNAITLETLSDYERVSKAYEICDESIRLIQVSRSKKAGNYHLMQSENGVYIISGILV